MSQLRVPGRAAPSRRGFLAAAALAGASAGAAMASGCSGASCPDATEVQLWHLFTGGDGGVFQSMLDTVSGRHPGIEIAPVVLTWGGPYYTKLAMSSVGGRSPDLAVMHATRIVGYAPGGLLDTWDLDRLAEHGITREMFPGLLWDKCFVDGQQFAVPLDFHAFLAFYNTDLCERAGVLDADGALAIASPEEFLDAGRRLASVTGGQGIAYGYTGDGAQVCRLWWGLYHQTGARARLTPGRGPRSTGRRPWASPGSSRTCSTARSPPRTWTTAEPWPPSPRAAPGSSSWATGSCRPSSRQASPSTPRPCPGSSAARPPEPPAAGRYW